MIRHLLPCLLVLCMGGSVAADYGFSIGFDRSQTDNLFKDTSNVDAPSSVTKASVNVSPFTFLELSGHGEYTYYPQYYDPGHQFFLHDLSSTLWGFSGVLIPMASDAVHRAYLQVGYDERLYKEKDSLEVEETGEDLTGYDSRTFKATGVWGYEVGRDKNVRLGSKLTIKRYPNSSSADNEQFELFAGANLTLLDNSSLDVEAGWGRSTYKYIDSDRMPFIPDDPYLPTQIDPNDSTDEGSFSSVYISPRLSRQLGSKTGVSLTFSYRHFFRDEKAVVLGFSTASLSPWNTFFDGTSIQLRLKTFILPSFIVSAGTAYWDKTYLKTVELVEVFIPSPDPEEEPGLAYWENQYGRPDEAPERSDWQSKSFIEIQRPIVLKKGFTLEPSVSVLYEDNRSLVDRYDYTSWTFRASVSLKH